MLPNIEERSKLFYGVGQLEGILVPRIPNHLEVVIAPAQNKRSCFILPTGDVGGTEYVGQGSCPEHQVPRFIQLWLKNRYLLALIFGREKEPFYSYLFEMFKTSPIHWRWEEVEKLQSRFPS